MDARHLALPLSPAEVARREVEREARRAGRFVLAFVGVPAAVAAGAALIVSALSALVLLAPVVGVVLTWVAWRYGRPDPPTPAA